MSLVILSTQINFMDIYIYIYLWNVRQSAGLSNKPGFYNENKIAFTDYRLCLQDQHNNRHSLPLRIESPERRRLFVSTFHFNR